jgi:hypothetical protein
MFDKHRDDFLTAVASFERHRKPQADLVQSFANAMDTLQATGEQVLLQQEISEMMGWILRNEGIESAPETVVAFLQTFDPRDHAGVSKLW